MGSSASIRKNTDEIAKHFATDIRDFAGIAAAWPARYARQPHPFSCVQVPAPLPPAGATVVGDFWIYAA
jgi:hypothetical protein